MRLRAARPGDLARLSPHELAAWKVGRAGEVVAEALECGRVNEAVVQGRVADDDWRVGERGVEVLSIRLASLEGVSVLMLVRWAGEVLYRRGIAGRSRNWLRSSR